MKKPIYVLHTFRYESKEFPFNNVFFPSGKPMFMFSDATEEYYNYTIEFIEQPQIYAIVIIIEFEEQVGEKRYGAFEEAENSGTNINLLDPPSGTIKAFIEENLSKWNDSARRIFNLIRWHYNLSLFDHLCSSKFSWFLTNTKINEFNTVSIEPSRAINWLQPSSNVFYNNVAKKKSQEPLHFNLLREAESNLVNNPKSALVLLVIALESGVKNFLITKKPDLKSSLIGEPNTNLDPPSLFKLISINLKEIEPLLAFKRESLDLIDIPMKVRHDSWAKDVDYS